MIFSRPRLNQFGLVWFSSLAFLLFSAAFTFAADEEVSESKKPSPRFKIEAPDFALQGVPLPSKQVIRITALTPDGEIDKEFDGPVEIKGVRFSPHLTANQAVFELSRDEMGTWKNGSLEYHSSLKDGVSIYIEKPTIEVIGDGETVTHSTRLIWKWFAIVPPLVAIVLAIWLKEVITALLAGVFSGALVLTGGQPFSAFLRTIDTHILRQIVPSDGGADHVLAMLFTLMLGGMIGIMSTSGGTRALVDRLTQYAQTREHGQIMTWLLGMVVFFDDYANTLLVGSTMRSVSDRLRISREKLAFLVDATAAPVAGLAIVSTWVGFEVSQIGTGLDQLGLSQDVEPYQLFLATIPYRFYPILLLCFVGMIAWSGRDFGPMRKCEEELALNPNPSIPSDSIESEGASDDAPAPLRIWNAILPLVVLLTCITVGFLLDVDSYKLLVYSAFSGVLTAALVAVCLKSLSLAETVAAGIKGLQSMLMAVVILVLAWSISGLCDDQHLNIAGFVIDGLGYSIPVWWMPATAFVIAAAVSFATGSSFATMGLLIPLFINFTAQLMVLSQTDFDINHPYMLGTIGAVLAGSIWGDHCSPISDTTVLSSAAAGCNHLSHVATQMPYAMTVGLVSLLMCYLPIGWGISPYVTLPLALGVLVGILFLFGKRPPEVPA